MSRLIDADALFKVFERVAWYNNADRDDIAEELLLYAPTVDAEPVVRCKDCKYGKPCYGGNLIKHCEQHPDKEYFDADYFCADGERRES